MIASAKQFENKLLSQIRKIRAVIPKIMNFRVVAAAVGDKVSIRDDVDGNLDLAGIDIEVNDFPFDRQTRVGMRSNG